MHHYFLYASQAQAIIRCNHFNALGHGDHYEKNKNYIDIIQREPTFMQ